MWIIHAYIAAVAVGTLATFTFITRGLMADMGRLDGAPEPQGQRKAA